MGARGLGAARPSDDPELAPLARPPDHRRHAPGQRGRPLADRQRSHRRGGRRRSGALDHSAVRGGDPGREDRRPRQRRHEGRDRGRARGARDARGARRRAGGRRDLPGRHRRGDGRDGHHRGGGARLPRRCGRRARAERSRRVDGHARDHPRTPRGAGPLRARRGEPARLAGGRGSEREPQGAADRLGARGARRAPLPRVASDRRSAKLPDHLVSRRSVHLKRAGALRDRDQRDLSADAGRRERVRHAAATGARGRRGTRLRGRRVATAAIRPSGPGCSTTPPARSTRAPTSSARRAAPRTRSVTTVACSASTPGTMVRS